MRTMPRVPGENRFDLPGSDYLKGMGRIPGSVLVGVR